MSEQYHVTVTSVFHSNTTDMADTNPDPKPQYERVETEIRCIGAKALARHLRAIADELDPQPPSKLPVNLVHPHYRSTNA